MFLLILLKDGSTALFKAAFKGHNSVIEELLKFSPSMGLLKVRYLGSDAFSLLSPVSGHDPED